MIIFNEVKIIVTSEEDFVRIFGIESKRIELTFELFSITSQRVSCNGSSCFLIYPEVVPILRGKYGVEVILTCE